MDGWVDWPSPSARRLALHSTRVNQLVGSRRVLVHRVGRSRPDDAQHASVTVRVCLGWLPSGRQVARCVCACVFRVASSILNTARRILCFVFLAHPTPPIRDVWVTLSALVWLEHCQEL